jgi:small conductance mechanosensitive channel
MDVNAFQILREKLIEWGTDLVAILPNLVLALVIFLVIKKVASLVRMVLRRVLNKTHIEPIIQRLVGISVQIAITFGGLLAALSVLNLDKTVTSVLAGLGLVGLALGYAFQDIIANFVSGIFISVNNVVHIGDYIVADGHDGDVVRMDLRTTTLLSPQGQYIMVPNSAIFQNTVINYTASGKRRVDIDCGVAYDSDLEKVETVVRDVIENLEARNQTEPVGFVYTEFGDSSINFHTNFWIEGTGVKAYFGAKNEAIKAIKKRFEKEGFDIPFPIRTLYQAK